MGIRDFVGLSVQTWCLTPGHAMAKSMVSQSPTSSGHSVNPQFLTRSR
jgi:hypothetical protein